MALSSVTLPDNRDLICNPLTEYYDISSSKCVLCDATGSKNLIPDTSSQTFNGNYLGCKCKSGYVEYLNDCANDVSGNCVERNCTSCLTNNFVSFSDSSSCVKCSVNETLGLYGVNSPLYGDCQCPTAGNKLGVLLEKDATGESLDEKICETCPPGELVIIADASYAGRKYTADLHSCQKCPHDKMNFDVSSGLISCKCASGYIISGQTTIGEQVCLKSSLASSFDAERETAASITFTSGKQLSSENILHYYVRAATDCTYYGGYEDTPACQLLANLCVLKYYDDASPPCKTFTAIAASRSKTYDVTNWGKGMPWVYYEAASTPCKDESIQMSMSLTGKVLNYVVATYTLNGTFLGYSDVATFFSYCTMTFPDTAKGGGTSTSTQWTVFGSTEHINFKCNLNSLLRTTQYFYELFLYDDKADTLVPIPVRPTNLIRGGGRPNKLYSGREDLCSKGDVNVRRFYLYDIISGITSDSFTTLTSDGLPVPQIIRYASRIVLDTRIRTDDAQKIYVPILAIEYTEVDSSAFGTDTSPTIGTVTFDGRYSMDTAEYFSGVYILFILCVVASGLILFVRLYNWRRRNFRLGQVLANPGAITIDMNFLLEFISLVAHSWVLFTFPVTVCVAEYWFVFFKLQDTVDVMLPPQQNIYNEQSDYFHFVMQIHILFFFQLIYVCRFLFKQSYADIFFMDWEPSKSRSKNSTDTGVSVWRTILVANEWNELQIYRRTNIEFSLFWIGFFLLGVGLEYNATQQPDLNNRDEGKLNIVLRFANTTWWWFVLSVTQLAWKYCIYERYISEPPEQLFVDLCTIAKISIIVLDEPYHGYYVHCRSPHQFADGSMAELVGMLNKEEAGLTVDRSLEGAPPDAQSFEIFLSFDWRTQYNKIFNNLLRPPTASEMMLSGRVNRGTTGGNLFTSVKSTPPDKLISAWIELNTFLQGFVDNTHASADLKRSVIQPTYLEKLLHLAPDLSANGQPSVFYPNASFDYINMTLLGHELDMLCLNILSYSLFDIWFNNTATSILLCYLLNQLLTTIRSSIGQATIARKTLVDERFLI